MNRSGEYTTRVLLIGLDSAAPQFVFGPQAFDLPNLRALAEAGCWGRLRSCHPPITVPAWACMTASKDPGTLGVYGFRNRQDYSYDALYIATASAVRAPRVWDILSRAGKKVVVLGVPQTYPVRPVNGWLVAGFLTPDTSAEYTYPKDLKEEMEAAVGEYIIDVKDFRTEDKDRLLQRIYGLMENRFAIARYLLTSKPWDFFMLVEMGMDRLHHGFWKYADPAHPLYQPGNPYENVLREYYRAVDRRVGELVALAGDNTVVIVVSDHGAKAMQGGVCINQWLIRQGLLVLQETPSSRTRIEDCPVDWSRTKVWSSGGYYGRLFLNVEGREPLGCIPRSQYEAFRDDLAARIRAMEGPDGKPLKNKVFKPQELYRAVNGIAPDLIVYFGDLDWRAVGSVGFETIFTLENDTGPDDANHDYEGVFVMKGAGADGGVQLRRVDLMDMAPTILRLFGLPIPEDMQGRAII